jgi:hypothetical protein
VGEEADAGTGTADGLGTAAVEVVGGATGGGAGSVSSAAFAAEEVVPPGWGSGSSAGDAVPAFVSAGSGES